MPILPPAARLGARPERLGCLVFLAAISCTSTSIRDDLARVQDLSHVPTLPAVAHDEVDAKTDPAIDKLLREPLDSERAVRIALLANRELRARLRELGIARGRILQAGLLPNPGADLELLPERSSRFELKVDYDLTRAILAPFRARALGPELERERFEVARAVLDLAYRVRVGLLRVQAGEQRVAIAQQSLLGLRAAQEAAKAMFDAGNVSALDVATQETAYEKGAIEVERLALELTREREHFARVLGIPEIAPTWKIEAPLPAAPEHAFAPDGLETRSLRASLELRAAREHLESLAREAGFTSTEGLIPDIDVDIHALDGRPENGGSLDWRFGAGVSASLPLFDRRQGDALALTSSFQAELERYYGRAGELRSEARELQQRVTSAHDRARRYQEVILPS
ncbi:MAG TPA: TolC family protein, partial [Polyangiales bacterium]|nr:TolC family protein [Polyangiales bacterium]